MKVPTIALALSIVLAAPALGAPGDPRLIQGKLEWPATLSGGEPFIVLRGDDGRVYYADVMAAQRYVQGSLSAGGHAALLGLAGIKPHEIIAVALGSGDTAALSLALAQATPPPTPTTPAPPSTTPSGVAAAAPAASPAASPATSPPARVESGRSAPEKQGRWVTIRGRVKGVAGRNLFLQKDDGGVVAVDIAKLDSITAERFRLDASVAVVVVPFADRYEATGLVETESGKPAR